LLSAVVNRLKHFLPQMEAANLVLDKLLKDETHADMNIESLAGCENSVIEMVSRLCFFVTIMLYYCFIVICGVLW